MRERIARALPALCGLAAFLALAGPALDPGVQLFYRDTARLYYPVKRVIAEGLARGSLPLWDKWTEAGISLLGQLTPGLFHPATLLYVALPFDLAFKLNHLLALPFAGAGAYLLARRLGTSRWSALLAGVVYGGSGFLVSMAASNLPFALGPAAVPLALERLLAFLDDRRPVRLFQASAMLSLCAYAGDAQSMLIAGVLGAAGAAARPLPRGDLRGAARGLGLAFLWGVTALALAAPAAVPAVARLRLSDRRAGINRFERSRFFVTPQRLPGLGIAGAFDDAPELLDKGPEQRKLLLRDITPFNEYFRAEGDAAFSTTLYLGVAALLLAGFSARRRPGRFLLLGALTFLLGACGDAVGVQEWFIRLLPGFRYFRYAEKLVAPASLLLALSAGLGADVAFGSPSSKARLAIAAGATAIALWLAAILLQRHEPGALAFLLERGTLHEPEAAKMLLSLLDPGLVRESELLAVLALLALASRLRPRLRGMRAVAAGVCAAGLVLANGPHLSTIDVALFHDPPPLARDLEAIAGPSEGRWRLYVHPSLSIGVGDLDPKAWDAAGMRGTLHPQFESIFHIEGVSNYFSAGDPHYNQVAEGAPAVLLPLLGTRFFVAMPRYLSEKQAAQYGYQRFTQGMWMQKIAAGPRAFLLDRATVVPDLEHLVQRLNARNLEPWRDAVLLPSAAAASSWPRPVPGSPGQARFRRPSPERIEVEVNARTQALLGVSEHFDPGWSARVDQRPARVAELDGALLAVPVPAGRHLVELRFWPEGLTWGIAVAGLTCLLFVLWTRLTGLVVRLPKIVRS